MATDFHCSVVPYLGNEDVVLELRNRNRVIKQSRAYMDWRFFEPNAPCSPLVFFLKTADQKNIGMAALIWRQYHVQGKPVFLPVLGDIGLDDAYRGKGYVSKLFAFIAEHARQNNLSGVFVMPNEAAGKRLATNGWQTIGRLAPYVCVIDAKSKLNAIFRLEPMAKLASSVLQGLIKVLAALHAKNITTRPVSSFDDDFDLFWRKFPRNNLVLRDRSLATLNWRYSNQPGSKYSIYKFYRDNEFIGYAVLDYFTDSRDCLVCDFVVIDPSLYQACLVEVLKLAMARKGVRTVRIILIENSPTAAMTRGLGFFKRIPITPFQIHNPPPEMLERSAWFITAGDKDA